VRSLLLALGGYAPDTQGKGKAAARAGLLPERHFDVPPEVAECRRTTAAALVMLLRTDHTLCLSAHASPVVQLLLRILRDRGDRSLLAEACAAVVGAVKGVPSIERCDALLHSAPGSRALEAAIETSSAELFAELFTRFFRPRLRALSTGEDAEFGPFLSQKLADGLREEPQLQLALAELDFTACLGSQGGPSQHVVVLKFLEAALRLRSGLKQAAGAVFRAFGLHASSDHHRAWPTLLALDRLEDADALQKSSLKQSSENQNKADQDDKASHHDSAFLLRNLPSAGPQILAMLLRYPAEAVVPISAGLPKMLAKQPLLVALAKEPKTARVLEAALAPSSALAGNLRLRMARAFKGTLVQLGPHHVGGWVCAALWRPSLAEPALRESFAKELLSVEEELRTKNYAVWKVCGLHAAKVRQEEWSQQQQKAGKTQRLFGELLEGGDAEAAKAAAAVRARAAEDQAMAKAAAEAAVLADPTVAALLPAPEIEGDTLDEIASQDLEIDGLGKRRQKKKPSEMTNASESAETLRSEGDSSLTEALELIKGRSASSIKRRKKKLDAKDVEDEEAGVITTADVPAKKKIKKGKRPGFTY